MQEWISKLQVGDKIYTYSNVHGDSNYFLTTVKEITPSGRIKLATGTVYTDGVHKINSLYSKYLKEWTQELEDHITTITEFKRKVRKIEITLTKLQYSETDNDKISKILEILNNP
ncbi:MAG: hypothetical protein KAS32_17350 [Candidatus Peribacteraceae bacterium]|nr:hypothetical protein [Candidatus Peribacteraceae bacterium]